MIGNVPICNFYTNKQLSRNKIPNRVYFKLINPNGEIIAGLYRLKVKYPQGTVM